MTITIEITCDNAAFVDNPREVSAILRDLADRLPDDAQEHVGAFPFRLYDTNGNHVGRCILSL